MSQDLIPTKKPTEEGSVLERLLAAREAAEANAPTVEYFLLELPLYTPVEANSALKTIGALRFSNIQLDAYCIGCKGASIFKEARVLRGFDKDDVLKPGIFDVDIACQRNRNHGYTYRFLMRADGTLYKIGQYPSLEDIAGADIERFRPLLERGMFAELRRAGGLASHAIGIGSFVYLRRIFEKLIYQHRDEAARAGVALDGFDEMRMDEKIAVLKSVLPPALVKNRATYAILSKGLHELSEEECLAYFPVLRSAIIRILEQDLRAKEERDADAELERHIGDIAGKLKGAKPKTEGSEG